MLRNLLTTLIQIQTEIARVTLCLVLYIADCKPLEIFLSPFLHGAVCMWCGAACSVVLGQSGPRLKLLKKNLTLVYLRATLYSQAPINWLPSSTYNLQLPPLQNHPETPLPPAPPHSTLWKLDYDVFVLLY